jgi:hypothetical protein
MAYIFAGTALVGDDDVCRDGLYTEGDNYASVVSVDLAALEYVHVLMCTRWPELGTMVGGIGDAEGGRERNSLLSGKN